MINEVKELLLRDLARLEEQVDLFEDNKLWMTSGDVTNSAGNLCLHLCGNLQHFIGHVLGNTDFKRDREFEFSGKDMPKTELRKMIRSARMVVVEVLSDFPEEKLTEPFPIEVFGQPMTTRYFLIHLQGHLNYHLGQINYLRRLL